MPLTAVTLKEIERIFEILDRLGISREAVVIPLRPTHPGSGPASSTTASSRSGSNRTSPSTTGSRSSKP